MALLLRLTWVDASVRCMCVMSAASRFVRRMYSVAYSLARRPAFLYRPHVFAAFLYRPHVVLPRSILSAVSVAHDRSRARMRLLCRDDGFCGTEVVESFLGKPRSVRSRQPAEQSTRGLSPRLQLRPRKMTCGVPSISALPRRALSERCAPIRGAASGEHPCQ